VVFVYWDMNERLCLEEIGELGGIEKIVLHYKWYLHINEDELRRDYLILQIEHEHGVVEFGFRPVRLRDAAVKEYLLGFLKKILRKRSIKRKLKKEGSIICLYQNVPIYSKRFDEFLRQYLNG